MDYNTNGRTIKKHISQILAIGFDRPGCSTESGIRWIVSRFEKTGSVKIHKTIPSCLFSANTRENIRPVGESVRQNSTSSTGCRSYQ